MAAAAEALLVKNQCAVQFTIRSGAEKKKEVREVFDCSDRKQIGDVLLHSSGRYAFEGYTIVRTSDASTQNELPPTHLLQAGAVYAVVVEEKTVTIQVKVDDDEPKRVEVPCSLLVRDLPWDQSDGGSARFASNWRPHKPNAQWPGRNEWTFGNDWIASNG
ncbi:hypothetical protein M3Y99_00516600 [Aphelenchoides fujianensis]|nr:hypothetical protein M3Y99_00516600 [Aphelenchoides fujianensis]